jgi:hypothetical protein
MKHICGIIVFMLLGLSLFGQIGGESAYEFLNFTTSARSAALGGKAIALKDANLSEVISNPSLLNPSMDNSVVLNFVKYFAGINQGYTALSKSVKNVGCFAVGMQYLNYGSFIGADETGLQTGSFSGGDYSLNLMGSKNFDSIFSVGVSLKSIYSKLERYSSLGMAVDLGATWYAPSNFTLALVVRNLGVMIKPYTSGSRESLPFEIQLAASKRLEHAPFRFSIVAHNLQKPDLTYTKEETSTTTILSDEDNETWASHFADAVFRHVIIGVEVLPFDNFSLRGGYNYQRRQELKIDERTALAGFSFGFGLRISRFAIDYGRATYHLAGASNHFSVAIDIGPHKKNQVKTETN